MGAGSPRPTKAGDQLVFCKSNGEGGDYRDAGEAFRAAVKAAGLHGEGRLSLHSLRHAFASLLIAKGLNVVFVSRQPGHHAPRVRASLRAGRSRGGDAGALEASYQTMTRSNGP